MARPRIGLALGSGSARGWSHIGVIEGLLAAGIRPDVVCGTSIGALVGAAHACGRLQELRAWAEAATWREIAPLLDVKLTGGGLIDGGRIQEFLRGLGIASPIETLDIPFAAVATDLASGREVWIREGAIDVAVRASIAMPGIISPARRDGKWLVDGGLVNPVPVSVCRALGAEFIIAVNLNGDLVGRRFVEERPRPAGRPEWAAEGSAVDRLLDGMPEGLRTFVDEIGPKLMRQGPETPGYFDVLANSLNIMQDQITRTRLAGEPPHIVVLPRLRDVGLLEFQRGAEVIAEGRASIEAALPNIVRQVER